MSLLALLILGIGLAMDAFAVATAKGLALGSTASFSDNARVSAWFGAWFGVFQGVMPMLGFAVASLFARQIQAFDHWIAFGLLALIGGNMIRESFGAPEERRDGTSAGEMLVLALATSVDALAVGISLAMLHANIWQAAAVIAAVTFVLTAAGVWLGTALGERMQKWATLTGGVVLVLLGLKILLQHLGYLPEGF